MKNKRIKSGIIIIVFAFMLVLSLFAGQGVTPAFADTSNGSSVIKDLSADPNFNFADYPEKSDDYSIQVIQIAESKQGNLFLYAYQPCQNTFPFVATEINMSLSESVDGTEPYGLKQVSTWGVFAKYLVEGVTVSSDNVRYYNITSIYRDWIKDIDKATGNDNTDISKYFCVAKLFKAETINENIKYSCKAVDVVEIKSPYVDYLSFGVVPEWGYIFNVVNWTDLHYVAFSTDKKIDTLKEADVTYTTQSYHFTGKNNEGYTYGEKSEPQYITLTGDEEFGVDGYKKYTWKSIMLTEDFIKTAELSSATKKEVEKCEFVLMFLKTSFKEQEKWSIMQGHYKIADGTKVSDVSILRLKFETDGITYNLGALMDKLEGDDVAGNKPDSVGFWRYIWNCIVKLFKGTASLTEQIVAVIALFLVLLAFPILLAVLSLCIPSFGAVMKIILKAIWTGIKYLFIGLWYVISAPVRLIIWIVKKIKGE